MPAPLLQALMIADYVYQDKSTGKWIICGVFDVIYPVPAGAVPQGKDGEPVQLTASQCMRAGSPFAYISVTEIHASKQFDLRYVDLEGNNVIFDTSFGVRCDDPTEVVKLAFPLPMLLAKPGHYALELLCENELIGSCRIRCAPEKEAEE